MEENKENYEIKFEFTGVLKESSEGGPYRRLPEKGTKHAAGYDFFNPVQVTINPNEIVYVKTGIKAKFPDNFVLKLYNRSSNHKKKGLVLVNGVGIIDADYYNNPDNDGEMAFTFQNITDLPVTISAGEKLGQGIFERYYDVSDYNEENVAERISGFGSTGA